MDIREALPMAKTGRRPGRPDTRGEIVAAAARCFARAGYDATSTRQVAADAGVDPALVRRFFGGKEELFTEVASALIDPGSVVAAVTAGPADQAGQRLLRYFLGLLGEVRQPGPLLGLVRSAVISEHAAHILRTFLAERVLGGIAEALHADQGELRTALTASQLVGIVVARYAVRLAPLAAADDDQLVGWVGPVLQYYLTGDVQPSAP
jgi:AcrR family transcriptional regulator